jgi:hypothetical protein
MALRYVVMLIDPDCVIYNETGKENQLKCDKMDKAEMWHLLSITIWDRRKRFAIVSAEMTNDL